MLTSEFDYQLPAELIAQRPAPRRDQSRLLVLDRVAKTVRHRQFPGIVDYLRPGDVLVLNDSKVIRARLRGVNSASGGQFEILLLEEQDRNDWWAMLRPAKRARVGTRIILQFQPEAKPATVEALVMEEGSAGRRRLRFQGTPDISGELDALGQVPLPPYIQRNRAEDWAQDLDRYQTVYAAVGGSVAAPTAGLHFTRELLDQIRERGVEILKLTLHVGEGTFAPVKAHELSSHLMHEERYLVGAPTAAAINNAKRQGRRVIAAGTTAARVLESVAAEHAGNLAAGPGRTRLFVYPPYPFRMVDVLLTNFHLPRSTLLMLVSAFAAPGGIEGREIVLGAYAEAVRERYRFFSYGDAMLIL